MSYDYVACRSIEDGIHLLDADRQLLANALEPPLGTSLGDALWSNRAFMVQALAITIESPSTAPWRIQSGLGLHEMFLSCPFGTLEFVNFLRQHENLDAVLRERGGDDLLKLAQEAGVFHSGLAYQVTTQEADRKQLIRRLRGLEPMRLGTPSRQE